MTMKNIQINGGITINLFHGDTLVPEELPARSVALDGAIRGPYADAQGRWSFDHHENCFRLLTLSTCEQVRLVLCLGGPNFFNNREVFVNDLDGDTLLSLWLIANPDKANQDGVRTLVRAVGAIDAHGPSGSLLLSEAENQMANAFFRWAIRPVTDLRGKVREVFDGWGGLIHECLEGISTLVRDGAPKAPPTPEVVVSVAKEGTFRGYRVCMGTCDGFGFGWVYEHGYDAAILYQDAADGSRTFTIAKRSDLVDLPIGPGNDSGSALGRLSALEPGWGGGSSIGGSPRLPGGVSSRLTPEQVWDVVFG